MTRAQSHEVSRRVAQLDRYLNHALFIVLIVIALLSTIGLMRHELLLQ